MRHRGIPDTSGELPVFQMGVKRRKVVVLKNMAEFCLRARFGRPLSQVPSNFSDPCDDADQMPFGYVARWQLHDVRGNRVGGLHGIDA